MTLEEEKFIQEETPIKIRILHDIEQLSVAGETYKELSKDQEIEVPYWAAYEITQVNSGEVIGETISLQELTKTHWREPLPPSRKISNIGANFYRNLRTFLIKLKQESPNNIEKLRDLERAQSMIRDIINCRLMKLVSLAASPVQGDNVISNLASEEKMLFTYIKEAVEGWRQKIVQVDENGKRTGES